MKAMNGIRGLHRRGGGLFLSGLCLGLPLAAAGKEAPPPAPPAIQALEPFTDERAAMQALAAKPTPANRAALARIRSRHALELMERAEIRRDSNAFLWAIDYAQSAAELVPDSGPYQMLAGYLYASVVGNPETEKRAERCFRTAIQRDPSLARAHWMLGELCLRHNRLAEAIDRIEAAIKLDLDLLTPATASALSWAYVQHRDFDRGLAFFSALSQQEKHADTARIAKAGFLQGIDRGEEASRELKRVASDRNASAENRKAANEFLEAWRKEMKP